MAIVIAGGCVGFGESCYAAEEDFELTSVSEEEEIFVEDEEPSQDSSEEKETDEESQAEAASDVEDSAEENSDGEASSEAGSEESSTEASSSEITVFPGTETIDMEEASEEITLEEASEAASTDTSAEGLSESSDENIISGEGPQAFSKAPGKWIKKSGKWTYINAKGEKADDKGNSLKNTLAYIGEKYYYFKNNYMVTGFLYFDKEGNLLKNNKSDKTYYARYFDPVSGIMQDFWFTVDGKDYYASKFRDDYGQIPVNQVFRDNYFHRYISDKTGAILKNQFVTMGFSTFYVQENGRILEDYTMAINGKLCRFDYAGMIITGVSASGHFYKKDGKKAVEAYMKSKDSKKPEQGVIFYTDKSCSQKLTNAWLYKDEACGDDSRTYYIDKNGEAANGIHTAADGTYCFDLETCKLKTDYCDSYKVGNNLYFCDHGIVPTTPGFYTGGKGYGNPWCYVLDKTGKIATGFITVWSDVYKQKKRYFFDENGKVHGSFFEVNGKTYLVNCYVSSGGGMPDDAFVMTKAELEKWAKRKANDDGSLYNGWGTTGGKKCYYYNGKPASPENAASNGLIKGKTYVAEIDGNYYWIDSDGTLRSGWFELEGDTYIIIYTKNLIGWRYVSEDSYMYFSPKDKAAVTGINKLPAPKRDKNGKFVLDDKGFITESTEKKEYCFSHACSYDYFQGLLMRNCRYTIDGKTYVVDEYGVIYRGKKGPVKEPGGTVYKDEYGENLTGRIEGYYYDPVTGYRTGNVLRKTGKKWYFYGSDGKENPKLGKAALENGKQIAATFNKDGSIKAFTDSQGKKLKSTAFSLGGAWYFLDKKGVPQTGMVKYTFSGSKSATTIYVESDGACSYKKSVSSDYYMAKVGKKIYVMLNGNPVTDTTKAYPVSNFDRLPAADKAQMEKYQFYAYTFEKGKLYFDNSDYKVPVYVNADGSVSARTLEASGKVLHLNKYGVPAEILGDFRKEGNSWYYTGSDSAGTAYITAYYEDPELEDSYVKLKITWDNNMKIGKVVDSDTGRSVTGIVEIRRLNPEKHIYKEYSYMYFKDGYPASGKKSITFFEGSKLTYDFDPDNARAYIPLMKHF